jgi:ankyrin repeat protein
MHAYSSRGARAFFESCFARDAQGVADALALNPALALETRQPSRATALIDAARRNDPSCARLLIPHSALNAADATGATALCAAADWGSSAIVEQLLKAGASPLLANEDGDDPLMLAAAGGHAACVELLARPAFCDAINANGHDALSLSILSLAATSEQQLACARALAPLASLASLRRAQDLLPSPNVASLLEMILCSFQENQQLREASAPQPPAARAPRL